MNAIDIFLVPCCGAGLKPGTAHPAQLDMVSPSMSTRPEPLHGIAGRKPGTPHPAQLAELAHSKVVNAAYFSPVTGGKVLTTCIGAPLPLLFLRFFFSYDRVCA